MDREKLKTYLDYDPETGIFTWIASKGAASKNRPAGGLNNKGYARLTIDGVTYYAHQLAWLYQYGYIPKEIDHIDRNKANNKIANLRDVSHQENTKNRGVSKNNKSGIPGVWKQGEKWRAKIGVDGKNIHLGGFDKITDAIRARRLAEIEHKFPPFDT